MTLIVVELLLRLLAPQPDYDWGEALFCEHPVLRVVLRPGVEGEQPGEDWEDVRIRANDHGYRDGSWNEKEGETRVMLLGDSFAFGWGCRREQAVAHRLDEPARRAVFNLAMPGDGLVDYYVRALAHRDAVAPDAVLVLLYVNDLFDERLSGALPEVPEVEPVACPRPRRSFSGLAGRSMLVRLVNRARLSVGFALWPEHRRRRLLEVGFGEDLRHLRDEGRLAGSFAGARRVLGVLRRELGDVPLAVAYLPPRYAVDAETLRELAGLAETDPETLAPRRVPEALAETARDLGIPFLDLTPTIRRLDPPPYFDHDNHLTEDGHAVVARALASFLDEAVLDRPDS